MNIFRWRVLKEANVLVTTLLGAFLDVVIRLVLLFSEAYKPPWKHLPGNVLYLTVILVNSFLIGRKIFPHNKKEAAKLAFKFNAQFIVGAPTLYLAIYLLIPCYVKEHSMSKLIPLALTMIVAFPLKVISRFCALSLGGINHTGNSFIVVAAAYGAYTIMFRILQAELESFD